MANKRQVIWSLESSRKVQSIIEYLLDEWGEKEAKVFLKRLKKFENLVVEHPQLYPASQADENLRKAVITKFQSVIYKIDDDSIRVLTILDHRQKP